MRLAASKVDDHRDCLHAEERAAIANAVAKRQHEFATGRYLARQAMLALGLPEAPVGRADDRSPIWPDACIGSISHTASLALAAVARCDALRGVGVDLEEADRVVPQLHGKLFTAWERSTYELDDPRCSGLLFSAKEAAYKAVNPVVGNFIGFQQVELDVAWPQQRFAVRYVGEHPANRLLDAGLGYFGYFQDHVVSLFTIP